MGKREFLAFNERYQVVIWKIDEGELHGETLNYEAFLLMWRNTKGGGY